MICILVTTKTSKKDNLRHVEEKSAPYTVKKYETREKHQLQTSLRQKNFLLILLVGTQQNQILQSIYFCLPTKKQDKTKKNRIPKASLKPILSYEQPFIRTHLNTTPRRFPQKQLPRVRSLKQAVELRAFQWPQQQRQLEQLWWQHSDPRCQLAWVHGTGRSVGKTPTKKKGQESAGISTTTKKSTQKHMDFKI